MKWSVSRISVTDSSKNDDETGVYINICFFIVWEEIENEKKGKFIDCFNNDGFIGWV